MTKRTLILPFLAALITIAALLSWGCQSTEQVAQPPVEDPFHNAIRSGTLAEARQQASEDDRLLIVVGTADWCGPCRRMKAETWSDRRVYDWAQQHALIYYVDIDEKVEVRNELKLTRIPQIVVFRGDEEVDRSIGYRDADTFLSWLNDFS